MGVADGSLTTPHNEVSLKPCSPLPRTGQRPGGLRPGRRRRLPHHRRHGAVCDHDQPAVRTAHVLRELLQTGTIFKSVGMMSGAMGEEISVGALAGIERLSSLPLCWYDMVYYIPMRRRGIEETAAVRAAPMLSEGSRQMQPTGGTYPPSPMLSEDRGDPTRGTQQGGLIPLPPWEGTAARSDQSGTASRQPTFE